MDLRQELSRRRLVLDGAMGTQIQGYDGLDGCCDELCLSNPDLILKIHGDYLEAGADIIETNTVNANALSLSRYGLESKATEINLAAAKIARLAAEKHKLTTGRKSWVAGSVGPTAGAGERTEAAYFDQISALINGGVDIILIETICDTDNAQKSISAATRAIREQCHNVEIILSATLDNDGNLPAGQTIEEFAALAKECHPLAIGLNCGAGIESLAKGIAQLHRLASCATIFYPNAGMPDHEGKYPLTPDEFASRLKSISATTPINIAGGCCGTTPSHIRQLARTINP